MSKATEFKGGEAILLDGDYYLIVAVGTCPLTGDVYALLRDADGGLHPHVWPPYFEAYTLPPWEAMNIGLMATL